MILLNGQQAECLPIADRGLQYGDGVWETLLIHNYQVVLLEPHLQRLQYGLDKLGIKTLDMQSLRNEISHLQAQQAQAILKIIITRGAGGRGYNPADMHCPATRIITLHPIPNFPSHYRTQGIQLTLCQTRLAHNPMLAGFKHLNRLEQVLARAEFSAPYQEGLVRDYANHIIEGTMSNVFIIKDNQVSTPTLDQCGIRGIMQNVLIDQLSQDNIHVIWQADVSVHNIQHADAIFMSNSVIGIWPVQSFTDKHTTVNYSPHPLIKKLQQKVDYNHEIFY